MVSQVEVSKALNMKLNTKNKAESRALIVSKKIGVFLISVLLIELQWRANKTWRTHKEAWTQLGFWTKAWWHLYKRNTVDSSDVLCQFPSFPAHLFVHHLLPVLVSLLVPGTMAVSCQHHSGSPDHLENRTSILMRSLMETSPAEQHSSPDIHLSASSCGFDCLVLFHCCCSVYLSHLSLLVLTLLV